MRAKTDQGTGEGLQRNVEAAYRFLMARYEPGDKLYLFGFSRGAFTVRSLAGMLHKCGLLREDNDNLLEFASRIYNTRGNEAIAAGFTATFSRSCPVLFVGVWDTVESLALNAGQTIEQVWFAGVHSTPLRPPERAAGPADTSPRPGLRARC